MIFRDTQKGIEILVNREFSIPKEMLGMKWKQHAYTLHWKQEDKVYTVRATEPEPCKYFFGLGLFHTWFSNRSHLRVRSANYVV